VGELADPPVSKAGAVRRIGSNPIEATNMAFRNKARQRAAQRAHYHANKIKYRKRQLAAIQRNRLYVWNYLQDKCCLTCGEDDPIVLEFDHRNRRQKDATISMAIKHRKFSIERLQHELDKCDILCANCHRRKTSKQLGFKKLKFVTK
jgi:5-methylcytosine-specific restriction endonuclease McrA